MYQSKYYTCDEIDERLLKGYYNDAVSKGYSDTFEQFKIELASIKDIANNKNSISELSDKLDSATADGAVTTDKLADGAVTFAKFSDDVQNFQGYVEETLGKVEKSNDALSCSSTYYMLTDLNIQSGSKFNARFYCDGTWSRFILCYNGKNEKRLLDTQSVPDSNGKWYEFTAPEDITVLGLYIERYTGTCIIEAGNLSQFPTVRFEDGAVTTEKLADGAVTLEKINNSVITDIITEINNKLLEVQYTNNLFNNLNIQYNKYITVDGIIKSASGWAISPFIPVVEGEKYTISAKTIGRHTGISWFNENKELIAAGGNIDIFTTHNTPEGASFMVFNVASYNNYSTDIMVVEGETIMPYEPFNQITADEIFNFDDSVSEVVGQITRLGKISVVKNGNSITISDGINSISGGLTNNISNPFSGNPVFDLYSWTFNGQTRNQGDDVAPMHAYNTTIGANHGQPCIKATINNHGLDNTAIGTGWVKEDITYYVMRIVDENNIIFLSENRGTLISPSFIPLTTGNITRNGVILTVSSISSSQLYPALKNQTLQLVLDGKQAITQDGTYGCDFFEIIENYDIMNPASTLQKIIARAGESGEPIYDGDAGIHIENVYRFTKSMSILVISNIVPVQQFAFSDAMFSQAIRIGANGVVKYYVPNSLPLGQYDMRTPLAMTWSDNISGTTIGRNQMKDPDNHPVNRVLQYGSGVGFALGFLTDRGVGQSLLNYTNYTFELRNNTGKVYPHGVDNKVGETLSPGQIYTAVMYRSLFVPQTTGNRMSMYHFDLDGTEYVYIDYSGTMLDKVVVDDSLNGRKVEILEAMNTELKSYVYNGGFYVKATYVEGETCYLVVKIS